MVHEIKPSKIYAIKRIKLKEPREFFETWWFKAISWFPTIVVKNVPPLRRYVRSRAGSMQFRAYCMLKEKKFEEAFSICIEGLSKFRYSARLICSLQLVGIYEIRSLGG